MCCMQLHTCMSCTASLTLERSTYDTTQSPNTATPLLLFELFPAVQIVLLGVCISSSPSGGDQYEQLSLQPMPLYSLPTDNVIMTCFASSAGGRLFMGGADGHLYEIQYEATDTWRRRRCAKVRGRCHMCAWGCVRLASSKAGVLRQQSASVNMLPATSLEHCLVPDHQAADVVLCCAAALITFACAGAHHWRLPADAAGVSANPAVWPACAAGAAGAGRRARHPLLHGSKQHTAGGPGCSAAAHIVRLAASSLPPCCWLPLHWVGAGSTHML